MRIVPLFSLTVMFFLQRLGGGGGGVRVFEVKCMMNLSVGCFGHMSEEIIGFSYPYVLLLKIASNDILLVALQAPRVQTP